jgi:2'-5' RNA ligase
VSRRRTTGLVVPVEAARPLVERWLYRIPALSRDVPPHVTVLWPFLEPDAVDHAVERDLGALFAGVAAFDVSLGAVGNFPDAAFLSPEPAAAFVRLTELVWRQYPECPPFAGAYDDIVPHLTVALDPSEVDRQAIARELAPRLPLRTRACTVLLFDEGEDGVYRPRREFALGAGTSGQAGAGGQAAAGDAG